MLAGRCSCSASNAVPCHDLVCVKAGAERTRRHECVKCLIRDSFQRSGLVAEVEQRVSWSGSHGVEKDSTNRKLKQPKCSCQMLN